MIRFERINKNSYQINFIIPKYLIDDIEYETEEIIEELNYNFIKEGKERYFYRKEYERNFNNRKEAIKIHGIKCMCCDFDFERMYGERGVGFIEIHHKRPLYGLEREVIINPKEDLAPVCSNCHRVIHRKKDNVLSIEELRELIYKHKRK